jgi:hypothetical protein
MNPNIMHFFPSACFPSILSPILSPVIYLQRKRESISASQVPGEARKLHNEELKGVYSLPNTFRSITSS